MSNVLLDISRVAIIDDNPNVREDYEFPISEAGLEPVVQLGPLGSLDDYLSRQVHADAAISDHQLRPANYASFEGADLVATWYRRAFPAILCTTFDKSNADQFRSKRRWLPVVMSPQELSPETLTEGLALVQAEFREEFVPQRRPWRALVRFVDYHEATNTLYAKLPGWSTEAVALRGVDLPPEIAKRAATQATFRCYAKANLGAEGNNELYLADWEN
jgi:hypothetical protein